MAFTEQNKGEEKEWLLIGKIVSTQGLKGEVRVQSYSDFPERFIKPGKRWIAISEQETPQSLELKSGRNIPGKDDMYVVKFAEIDSCDRAESLRNHLIFIPAELKPKLAKDEFYVPDLIDCQVFDHQNQTLIGKVVGILEAGNQLLEVETERLDSHQKPIIVLIPFVAAIAIQVDISQKRIEVTLPDGLL
jgi:16S rRNA processing protein RimM